MAGQPSRVSIGGNAIAAYVSATVDTDTQSFSIPAITDVDCIILKVSWGDFGGNTRTVNSVVRDGQAFTAISGTLFNTNLGVTESSQWFVLLDPNINTSTTLVTFSGNINLCVLQAFTYKDVVSVEGGNNTSVVGTNPAVMTAGTATSNIKVLISGIFMSNNDSAGTTPVAPSTTVDESTIGGYIAGGGFTGVYERICTGSGQNITLNHENDDWLSNSFLLVGSAAASGAELDGDAVSVTTAAGELSASVSFIAASINNVFAQGDLSSEIWLESEALSLTSAVGGLDTIILLNAASVVEVSAQGEILTSIDFGDDAVSVVDASGDLTTGIQLSGDAIDISDAIASLTVGGAGLQADAQIKSVAAGDLVTQILIDADALNQTLASAGLTVGINLSAVSEDTVLATVVLTTQIKFTGDAAVVAAATASLVSAATEFGGDAAAVVNATAELATKIRLTGDAKSLANAEGSVESAINLTGDANSQVTLTVDLGTQISLTAGAVVNAMAAGHLETNIRLMGFASDVVNATGAISNAALLTAYWFEALAKNQASLVGKSELLTKLNSEVRYAA